MFGISIQALALMAAAGSMIDIVIVLALLGVVGTARWLWR
jgi:multisubunit Na+/H+ antiporter MnhF subunit